MQIHHSSKDCIICGEKQKGLGYCNKHLIRFKKYGCPFYSKFYTPEKCKKCDRSEEKVQNCLDIFFK